MKKILKLFTLCILTLSFAACSSPSSDHGGNSVPDHADSDAPVDQDTETTSFQATLLEVNENYLLVEPAADSDERKSSDQISVGLGTLDDAQIDALLPELEPGDLLEIEYDGLIAETYPAQITGLSVRKITDASTDNPSSVDSPASVPEPETTGFVRMVMMDDKLFTDTGEVFHLAKCGNMDFNFDSSVEQGAPVENYQTNFGIGYGGQYGMRENRIHIYINNEWHVFAYNENNLEGISMEITENTNHSLALEVSNDTDLRIQYGDYYTLEMLDKETDTWTPVPYADSEIVFNDIAYMPSKNNPVPWSVDWTQMYGELESGTYRIVKPVDVIHEDGNLTGYTLMTEFEITD